MLNDHCHLVSTHLQSNIIIIIIIIILWTANSNTYKYRGQYLQEFDRGSSTARQATDQKWLSSWTLPHVSSVYITETSLQIL